MLTFAFVFVEMILVKKVNCFVFIKVADQPYLPIYLNLNSIDVISLFFGMALQRNRRLLLLPSYCSKSCVSLFHIPVTNKRFISNRTQF